MFSLFITGVIKNKYISGPQSKVRRMWAKFEWKQIIDVVQQRMPFHFQWPLLRSLLTQIFMSGSKRENDKALSESFIFYSSTLSFSLLVPLSFLLPFILSRFVVFPSASLAVLFQPNSVDRKSFFECVHPFNVSFYLKVKS